MTMMNDDLAAGSYRADVIADSSGKWVSNALRFATEEEAKAYGVDLAWRWTSVTDMRVVECADPVTHRWSGEDRKAMPL
jgi:hypothetical protein